MSSPYVVALRLGEPLCLGKPESGLGMVQMAVLVRLGELLLHLDEPLRLGKGWPMPR